MRRILPSTVTAVTLLAASGFAVLVASPTSLAGGVPSSAYGIQAAGPVPIEPSPYVESSGGPQEQTAVELPPESPVQGTVLSLRAHGNASTANVHLTDLVASSEDLQGVVDQLPELPPELEQACADIASGAEPLEEGLDPLTGVLPEILQGLSVDELCNLTTLDPAALISIDTLKVWCAGDEGGMSIANLNLLGQPVNVPSTGPNSTLIPQNPLDAAVKITLNQQTQNPDGSFTVNGVVVDLGGGEEVITLGSATCGEPTVTKRPPKQPDAPRPTPVPTHHPVTG
jgi:hypothetical protein